MKKRLILSGLVLLMLAAFTRPVLAVDTEPSPSPADVTVLIGGKQAEFAAPLFILNSATYVSIREFASAMGADNVAWDNGAVTVTAPDLTVTASAGSMYIVANGRYLFVPDGCLLVGGSLMLPIRVIAKAFNAIVVWNGDLRTINVTKLESSIMPGSAYYDKTDLYWLSRIISGEARGESLTGKIAVGGVIMNRLNSPDFPKTVYDVIFDRRYGVQFTPTSNGAIYATPSEECVIAAKIALDGGNTAGDSLYFAATTHCWAGRSRPYAMTIGNHYFYA
jgi:N-acetylmuramoyl-L-alanine amidase